MYTKIRNIINKPNFIFYVIIIYIVGFLGLSLTFSSGLFIKLIPWNILLANLVLFFSIKTIHARLLFSIIFIGISGFYLEYFGIKTGQIFGVYEYGKTLGPKALDVPLLIGLNWVFMVLTSVEVSKKITKNNILIPFLSGACMLLYDIFLEKFAIHFGLWYWYSDGVPIQNYVSWFAFGTFFSCIYYFTNRDVEIPIARPLYLIQILFFIFLSFTF